jgi:spore germination cell wall hydrolase CwlJ-like protein
MRIRLYTLLVLFLISSFIFVSASFSTDRLIDVRYEQLTKDAKKQIDCLADNIYHEAGYEPDQGKVAVALVTMNRVQDPRYPKDICSVVKQKVNYTCQFTWFCQDKYTNRQKTAYEESRDIALHVYANYEKIKDFTNGALFYHADYVNPHWRGLEKTTVIGRHIFYKEKAKL